MDWQLFASYFTVKSTDIFYSVFHNDKHGDRGIQQYRYTGKVFQLVLHKLRPWTYGDFGEKSRVRETFNGFRYIN